MKYIANIITKSKIDVGEYINVTNTLDEVNLQIPTLIIGWENVKRFYPQVDILNKKITDTIFWTYSNREKRQEYEPDLNKFIRDLFVNLGITVKYTFFNVLTSKLKRIKDFIKYIQSDLPKVIYVTNKNVYIYNGEQITGFSISDLEYYGIKKEKVINLLKRNINNRLFFNDNFLTWKIKKTIGDNDKIIPFLYSLKYDLF
jgi:hypothetical protein